MMQISGHSLRSVFKCWKILAGVMMLVRFQWFLETVQDTISLDSQFKTLLHKIALTFWIMPQCLQVLHFLNSVQSVWIQNSAAQTKLKQVVARVTITTKPLQLSILMGILYIFAQIATYVSRCLAVRLMLSLSPLVSRLALLLVIASQQSSRKFLVLRLHQLCELRPFVNLCIQWLDFKI